MANETLFRILSRQPWWVSGLVAAALFALGEFIYPPVAPFVALPFLVVAAYVGYLQIRGSARVNVEEGLADLRKMPWEDFSRAITEAYRRQGYQVDASRDKAYDYDVTRNGRRTLLLCRRWKVNQVGAGPLHELKDAMERHDAYNAICIATGEYSANARAYAQGLPLTLLTGREVVELIGRPDKPRRWFSR
ncbi:MAG TPA: restriction endonuclease [Burkholderiales bacterium]|nr:restriction endonuclease [Burkholderiales bacterium]